MNGCTNLHECAMTGWDARSDSMQPCDADDPALHAIFLSGGRATLLAELKAREYGLRERQELANAISRTLRKAAQAPVIERQQPTAPCWIVVAEAGLCNKLRVLLSYREVAQDAGHHLLVVWQQGNFCAEHYDDLFEPIDGMTVLRSDNM